MWNGMIPDLSSLTKFKKMPKTRLTEFLQVLANCRPTVAN